MITLLVINIILLFFSIRIWIRELILEKDINNGLLYLTAYYIAGWVLFLFYLFVNFCLNYLP